MLVFLCYNGVMELDFSHLSTVELIIMTVAGAAVLLFGYRIKKAAFFIVWFILGLNLTVYALPWLNTILPDTTANDFWQTLIPICGGLLLALLGFTIEKLCVGGICFVLVLLITIQYFGTSVPTIAAGIIIGAIAAGVAVMLMKPAIIIATSMAGAYALAACVFAWFNYLDPVTLYFPILIGATAVGTVFQFATTRHID